MKISVSQAEKIILAQARLAQWPVERVTLENAYGRIMRESIKADRDQPAFNKSTMDGIAISFDRWQKGNRTFRIEAVAPAGKEAYKLKTTEGCVQIMTGAVVPLGCDCVIPIEQVKIENKMAFVSTPTLKRGQFIRYQGADLKKGAEILNDGCRLLAPQIATAASFGKSKLGVSAKPRVAIIATGDELVDIGRKNIKPYQVRKSNSYALDALLHQTGLCETQLFHLIDDKRVLLKEIKGILRRFDILLLSGGVSMGEFDFVPQVLKELGVSVLFHKVAQKPGKPFWFGKDENGKVVFALPGNPVSTQICAYRYVVPYLYKAMGLNYNVPRVALDKDFLSTSDLTLFIPVKIHDSSGNNLNAVPVSTGGSGDYASLSRADGFVELEAGRTNFPKGFIAPFYSW